MTSTLPEHAPDAVVPRQWRSGAPRPALPAPSRRRLEPWRDALVIGLATHAVLLVTALLDPGPLGIVLMAVPLACVLSIGTLTVLHDAGHRMFGRSAWPNVLAVQLAVPVGLWVGHWTLKHRVHHKLSQVYPVDESTRSSQFLRLHREAPLLPVHRFQHVYAWGLYCLAWVGELRSQLTYVKTGVVTGTETPPFAARLGSFLGEKALWLVVLSPYAWSLGAGRTVLLVVVAMTIGSLTSAVVLVVGHINEGLVSEPGAPREWAAHLVRTTASFSTDSLVARLLTGGMTHHLAHHLRPGAVRSQFAEIQATVVPEVLQRVGLPQSEYPTFVSAVRAHHRRLRELGAPGAEVAGG